MLSRLLHPLLSLGGWQAYALVGGLCFGETAFLLGFVLPGETAVVLGGVLAYEGHVSLVWMAVLAVCCAVVGDSVGYGVGKLVGPRLLRLRPMRRPAVGRAQDLLRRRGRPAVFVGRFTAVFRTLMPGVAGMSGLRYRKFLQANVPGGVIWGIGYTMAGWAVGLSYRSLLRAAGVLSYVIVGLAIVAFAGWHALRRLHGARRGGAAEGGDDRAAADAPVGLTETAGDAPGRASLRSDVPGGPRLAAADAPGARGAAADAPGADIATAAAERGPSADR